MKNTYLFLFCCVFLLSGCTSNQFSGVATGSMLGGMFGSSIGGIFGGYRGHDVGGAIGMLAGGAVGAAVTAERSSRDGAFAQGNEDYGYDRVEYGSYRDEVRRDIPTASSDWDFLEVTAVRFSDANDNRCLDAGERAFLTMEIYNRGDRPIRDIAPRISCDNRRVAISPTAIVSRLEPGQGFRYKAEIIAPERLKEGLLTFNVAFGNGKRKVTAKSFRIRTAR